jgi:hypothetical protein
MSWNIIFAHHHFQIMELLYLSALFVAYCVNKHIYHYLNDLFEKYYN